MYLVLGNCLVVEPVRALCIRNLVMSTGALSDVVWLGWVVVICRVRISRILAFTLLVFKVILVYDLLGGEFDFYLLIFGLLCWIVQVEVLDI